MSRANIEGPVPAPVLRKLHQVRQRKLLVQVVSALVAAAAVFLTAMSVAMLVDWLAELYDSPLRILLTTSAVVAALVTTAGWLLFAWRRMLRLDRVATDIDQQIPQLEERWTTMTRLGADAANPSVVHPAMLRRLSSEALRWEPQIDPTHVTSLTVLLRSLIGLTAITAILGIAVLINTRRTLVLLHRFWWPTTSISETELANLPGNIVVARGETLELTAVATGVPVERANLYVRTAGGDLQTFDLVAHGRDRVDFSHRVAAVEKPMSYRFRAGDGQSDWYTVDVADRPEIESLALTLTPPAYAHQEPIKFDKLPAHVSALQGSDLDLAIRPKTAVERVDLRIGKDKVIRLSPSADGCYRWKTTLQDTFTFTSVLTESHGLTNHRPPECAVTVVPDRPPSVRILSPDSQVAVRPDDTVNIAFTANDDIGIGSAELIVYDEKAPGDSAPLATISIPLGEQQGARSIQQSIDLNLANFKVEEGSALSYEIRVREDRGLQQPSANDSSVNKDDSKRAQDSGDKKLAGAAPKPSAPSTNSAPKPSQAPSQTSPSQDHAAAVDSQAKNDAAQPKSAIPPKSSVSAANEKTSNDVKPAALARNPGQPSPSSTPPGVQPNSSPGAASNSPPARDKSPDSMAVESTPSTSSALLATPPSAQSPEKSLPTRDPSQAQVALQHNPASSPLPSNVAESAKQSPKPSTESSPGQREASSARQEVSASTTPHNQKPSEATPPKLNGDNTVAKDTNEPSAHASSTPSASSNNTKRSESDAQPNATQQASSTPASEPSKQEGDSSPSGSGPRDSMPRRTLDAAQAGESKRMQLKVDKWAGSFSGQQRAKAEMAIAPELEALDKALASGQQSAGGVLNELKKNSKWRDELGHEVSTAEQATVEAQGIINKLKSQSKDTPYSFIGLQVIDIGIAHVDPAKNDFWKTIQSEGDERPESLRDGWQHLGRARELVAELRGQFERARRDFRLAETVEKVKKMYQVYVENSHGLLDIQDSDPKRYNRKLAEFELDDDYLKRLQEVLKMRTDLESELARVLAADPRLLRRYMDGLRHRAENLREELAKLSADQADLNREVQAWVEVEEANRPQMSQIMLQHQVQKAARVSSAAGELQSRYQAWLPLDRQTKDADLAAATKTVQEVANAASELNALADAFVAKSPELDSPSSPVRRQTSPTPASAPTVDEMIARGQQLYEHLNALQVSLRQLAGRDQDAESSSFAANRLLDTQRLVASTSAWIRQMQAYKAGNYTGAAEVDQYRLAMKTDDLTGKLGKIEATLAAALERRDGTLPEPIAVKAREFIADLDKQAAPNQLGAVYALHSKQLRQAVTRQKAAGEALANAEKLYDELMRLTIVELDKLPVEDPISQVQEDPTLDEMLTELEQEFSVAETLGIPERPSNLRIIKDWLQPNSGASGGGGRTAMNQLQRDQQQAQKRLDRAYRQAIAKALKTATPTPPKVELPKGGKMTDWNRLVSHLGDGLRQGRDKSPPEQYRKAIEQYFTQISKDAADKETPAK